MRRTGLFLSCFAAAVLFVLTTKAQPLAFPGAEGFGKYSTGGRGGKVIYVDNLNDSGPGSLRDALNKNYPRIILFSVSGTIHLESPLKINKGDVSIAGQSAPGGGICIADYPVGLSASNVIIRFIRFRMGDKNQNKGMVDGAGADDAFSISAKRKNIIIDHCSMSWSTDEALSVYAGDSTTLQWNIISEPLNYSYHFEEGDKDFEHHGYGGIWGGQHLSAHHNLFAHCNSRTPRFDGIRNAPSEFVDFRNNVLYNWGSNNVYAGEGGNYNIADNYYKYGPSTGKKVKFRIANPYKLDDKIPFGKFYVKGNYVDGAPEVTDDNAKGVDMNDGTEEDKVKALVSQAFPTVEIPKQTAKEAYEWVLKCAGACLPKRDTVDQRIVKDVEKRSGKFIDVQGGYAHGAPYSQSREAWPVLRSEAAPSDTDKDGMPDVWEKKRGLNPDDAADAVLTGLNKYYTNVEMYLNSLVR